MNFFLNDNIVITEYTHTTESLGKFSFGKYDTDFIFKKMKCIKSESKTEETGFLMLPF